jgi:hypothetical protein
MYCGLYAVDNCAEPQTTTCISSQLQPGIQTSLGKRGVYVENLGFMFPGDSLIQYRGAVPSAHLQRDQVLGDVRRYLAWVLFADVGRVPRGFLETKPEECSMALGKDAARARACLGKGSRRRVKLFGMQIVHISADKRNPAVRPPSTPPLHVYCVCPTVPVDSVLPSCRPCRGRGKSGGLFLFLNRAV